MHSDMPIWSGSVGLQISRVKCLKHGDLASISRLDCDIHTGTHVDASRHFVRDGDSIDQIPLDIFCGSAFIAALTQVDAITVNDLTALSLPKGIKWLLLKTCNSELWKKGEQDFDPNYVALTTDAARWVVNQGIRLIGVSLCTTVS